MAGLESGISTITGERILSDTERVQATTAGWKGIMSAIKENYAILEGSNRGPEWQMASWTKGIDPSTKLGILKGLAKDVRSIPKSEINPTLIRQHYQSLHNTPGEILTEADKISFVPHIPGATRDSSGSIGLHRFNPEKDLSQIQLSTGTSGLSKEKSKQLVQKLKDNPTAAPVHEVVHMMQRKKSLRNLFKPETSEQLDDLIKISAEKTYAESPLEFMSKAMEDAQSLSKASGKKLTKKQMVEDFETLTKFTHKIYK